MPGGGLQAQVSIILHEFAHILNLIPSDSGNNPQASSSANSQAILAACPSIGGLSNRDTERDETNDISSTPTFV